MDAPHFDDGKAECWWCAWGEPGVRKTWLCGQKSWRLWLVRTVRNLEICSAYQAEVWAALLDLFENKVLEVLFWKPTLPRSIKFSFLQTAARVEMDVLLSECKSLLRRDWTEEVKRIYREANYVADGGSNWVPSQSIRYQLPHNPLTPIWSLLLADLVGMGRPRFVSNCGIGMYFLLKSPYFHPKKNA